MFAANSFVESYMTGFKACLDAIRIEHVGAVAARILQAYRQDRLVAIVGNGGSAASASHMACDLMKGTLGPRYTSSARRLRAMALTDSVATITALANDISYQVVFSEQLRTWVGTGDVVVLISASGNSANIVEAAKTARELGAFTIGFLGFGGGLLKDMVDLPVVVPSNDYGYVEDMHMMLSHLVTAYVRQVIAEDLNKMAESHHPWLQRALILAAGEGSRLRPLTLDRPKPMLPINGTPLLDHILCWLQQHEINEVAINLHYHAEVVMEHLGDGSRFGTQIVYSCEEQILGTAGAVRRLKPFLKDGPFVVVYGDVLTDLDLDSLLAFHRQVTDRDPSAKLTMALYHVPNPTEVGLVGMNLNGRINRFVEKPKPEEVFTDLANAGVLVVEPELIDLIPAETFFDFGHDLFPLLMKSGISMYGWVIPERTYVLDIGTPEKYAQAQIDWPGRQVGV